MIVSHAHKFIFLRTEKTASTSLTELLRGLMEPGDEMFTTFTGGWARALPVNPGALKRIAPGIFGLHFHARAADVRAVLGARVFDSYYKFTVERNPWERQVSLYSHRQWKRGRAGRFDTDMRSALYRALHYSRLNNWAIYAIGDRVVADRVLRFESLSDDLGALFADLGTSRPPALAKRRDYTGPRDHYSTFYSPASRDLVGRWYHREISAFGYRFEDRGMIDPRAAGPAAAGA